MNLVISTLTEVEFILPTLKDFVAQGRPVNVLCGLPISPGPISRLAAVGRLLGRDSISVLLDHPEQVAHLGNFGDVVPHAYIKVNMGGKRAGVIPGSSDMKAVIEAALQAHREGKAVLKGLYSHAGHSYGGDSRVAAMKMLGDELSALVEGAEEVASSCAAGETCPQLTLSVGASPTALSIQNLLSAGQTSGVGENNAVEAQLQTAVGELSSLFERIRAASHTIEIHAGVYPTLDLQQLAAHSVSSSVQSWGSIAFTVLAEVISRYNGRGEGGTDEYLIGAGGLALGRETCKAYPGMAMLTPWNRKAEGALMPDCDVEHVEGWMVGRFAQEHGIVTWRKPESQTKHVAPDKLEIGQTVRLWPNHACITGSHFGWYFVVDSSREGKEDEIVDVWLRTRGW